MPSAARCSSTTRVHQRALLAHRPGHLQPRDPPAQQLRRRRPVFQSGEGLIIHDPYNDKRFNDEIDRKTGFVTKSILCAPIKTARGEVIGVVQTLNKRKPATSPPRTCRCSRRWPCRPRRPAEFAVHRAHEEDARSRRWSSSTSCRHHQLARAPCCCRRVMSEATRMLKADRSTLFLNNEKTNELWSEVGEGLNAVQIKLPNTGHRRRGVPPRARPSTSRTPTPTCASTPPSTRRPAISPAPSSACRWSTSTASASASPRC
jgi:hypothetical protein